MPERDKIGLPIKPFFYTLDQLSELLQIDEGTLKKLYLFYEGRDVGIPPRTKMPAVNVAQPGEKPMWRVSERHLIGWLRSKGLRFYHRGY